MRAILLILFVPLAHAQPARLTDCAPFVKGGKGTYFVEPVVNVGQEGVHFAWACKLTKPAKVHTFVHSCSFESCNAVQLTRSLWRVTTGQSTLAAEWAEHSNIPYPVKPESEHYPLALEAVETLHQLQDRIDAKVGK